MRTLQTPLISVITPVGPRHHEHVKVARASVAQQTIPAGWVEHITIYDTERQGPAACRNEALEMARGAFVVCLDADDYLIPSALETYLRGFAATDAAYVYADNYVIDAAGRHSYSRSQDYDQRRQARYNQHVVTALVPTELARAAGGFDTAIDIWEDWTLWLRLAINGWCGARIPRPALVYRLAEGERMRRGLDGGAPLMEEIWRRYADDKGQIVMCGCNTPKAAATARQQAQIAVQVLGAPAMGDNPNRLEYAGPKTGSFYVTSPATRRQYKLGGRRLVDAAPEDREWLISLGCQPVTAAPFSPPPEPGITDSDVPDGEPVFTPAPALVERVEAELAEGPEAPAADAETFTPRTMKRRKAAEE